MTLAAIAPVRAETVAVLDVRIEGVPPEGRDRLEANLEEGLRGAGFTIVSRDAVQGALVKGNATAGCTFGPCLRAVGTALGIELVLVVRITAEGPSFTFVLTLVDTKTGAPAAQVADSCAVCTYDEAMSAATLAVVDLGSRYHEAADSAVDKPKAQPPKPKKKAPAAAWWVTGAAVVAGSAAGYILLGRDDHEREGWITAGAAGGLLIGGLAMFVFD